MNEFKINKAKKGGVSVAAAVILFESVMAIVCSGLLYRLSLLDEKLYIASKNRFEMTQAADMLRQSSDDLTNFARSYAVTEDESFRQKYFKVLDIRNGSAPRPRHYEHIYWDLLPSDIESRHPNEEKIALKEIFAKLPFTPQELSLLTRSEASSNKLVNLEVEAFNAVNGLFKDANGEFAIQKEPDKKFAATLLYSKEYYDAKREIMNPIDEFMATIEQRTQETVEKAKEESRVTLELFVFSALVFIIGNFFALRAIDRQNKNVLEARVRLEESKKSLEKELALNEELEASNKALKETKDVLFELNRTLEGQIEQKSAALVEKERLLIQQSKMAMMGEMIGAIAHQWRQPLNAVAIMSQDVKIAYEYGEIDEEYVTKFEKNIMDQVGAMSRTIDDFRNFFAPNKKAESFCVKEAINETLNIINSQLKAHGVEVFYSSKNGEEIFCFCYRNELKQVLLNVLANAKDALIDAKAQKAFIKIATSTEKEGVKIELEDSAGGIKEELLEKIFESYFTTKQNGKGTGIGLYMSRQIMEQSIGGAIWAANGEHGAKFTIFIPNKCKVEFLGQRG